MSSPPAPPTRRTRRHRGANQQTEDPRAMYAQVEAQFTAMTRTLEGLNGCLAKFNRPAMPTKTQARRELATIHININDFVAERFHMSTRQLLRSASILSTRTLFSPRTRQKPRAYGSFCAASTDAETRIGRESRPGSPFCVPARRHSLFTANIP
eukprot:ANDGO_07314.mRNA.1 hypothetical protein